MFEMKIDVPSVEVMTTNNRGFTPEEIAQECMKKVIYISDNTCLLYTSDAADE